MATFPAKTNYAAGNVLTAAQMVNIGEQINALNGCVGKNKIINGDFNIWQRGTSFTNPGAIYTADRWVFDTVAASGTVSRQAFTNGQTTVPNNPNYFMRIASTSATGQYRLCQRIEAPDAFSGQQVTLSFWAKTPDSATVQYIYLTQANFASGARTDTRIDTAGITLTSSWTKYTFTGTFPSTSGKTTNNTTYASVEIYMTSGASKTLDIANVQLEFGNTATAFQTATGTLQGELAACQRYYHRIGENSSYQKFGNGIATSATNARIVINHPVQMRIAPSSVLGGNLAAYDAAVQNAVTAVTLEQAGTLVTSIDCTSTGLTTSRATMLIANNSLSAYLAFDAEL